MLNLKNPERLARSVGKLDNLLFNANAHNVVKNSKCSDRSMEVLLASLLEKYDRLTNQPTDQQT